MSKNWIDLYADWAMKRSPLTPRHFHENIALALVAGAVAGRCYAQFPHETIYPNLYILIVSKTTLFGKTTAFNRARELIRLTMPEKTLTEICTPEAFVTSLSGKRPENFAKLSQEQKKEMIERSKWGARRLYLLDEAGRLFNILKRDYASDLADLMMSLYDPTGGPVMRTTRKMGTEIIDRYALSCLFATTPAGIRSVLSSTDQWTSGFWIRWNFACQEELTPYIEGTYLAPPESLVKPLFNISRSSFEPYNDKPHAMILGAGFQKVFSENSKRVREQVDVMTEERLHGLVGRLPISRVKAAMLYAILDANGEFPIRLKVDHWEMAQKFAEGWYRDAERVIDLSSRSEKMNREDRLRQYLFTQPCGATARELSRYLHCSAEETSHLLDIMKHNGEVDSIPSSNTTRWKIRTEEVKKAKVSHVTV